MEDFYKQTGGVTLLVIRHNSNGTFDYVNGSKGNQYFPKWGALLPFMRPQMYYVVFCAVTPSAKASLMPLGIAFEIEDLAEAKAVSLAHRHEVESGKWDAKEELPRLQADWEIFKFNFMAHRQLELDLLAVKAAKLAEKSLLEY